MLGCGQEGHLPVLTAPKIGLQGSKVMENTSDTIVDAPKE